MFVRETQAISATRTEQGQHVHEVIQQATHAISTEIDEGNKPFLVTLDAVELLQRSEGLLAWDDA